tara:strand:+ start:255 stop:542 length:288 start_codon:yes stop_codon:yes gene_type:complete
MGRYNSDTKINQGRALGNPAGALKLRAAYNQGQLSCKKITLGSATRLDHLAFQHLGDPSYWWAIACLSNIGWGLQLPAGTYLVIPKNLDEVKSFI